MFSSVDEQAFLVKAEENLASATSEFANGRYNACANRCYYACFQAAIAALLRIGIRPSDGGGWGHAFVQAQFAGQLIARRRLYSGQFRDVLTRLQAVRNRADYEPAPVSEPQARRALARAREFVAAIQGQGDNT